MYISIALSPSQHNTVTKGHEFNPSTEKKVTQETCFECDIMYACVCVFLRV